MTYYFIGIKGSGMSSLAQVMKDRGFDVKGSDKSDHFFTERGLLEKNIEILPFSADNIKEGMIIVRGNAFGDENVEVKRAKELGLKMYTYQEMINELTESSKLIAISGCHGKTTTTTMMSKLLEKRGVDYLVGDGTGGAKPGNGYFALEACEFKRHFLEYKPYYSVITNVELDHTDYYKNLDDVVSAFTDFANLAERAVIIWGDDPTSHRVKTHKKTCFYGFNEDNDAVMKNVRVEGEKTFADVYIEGKFFDSYEFPFVGDHLLLNVLAAITVCYLENIDKAEIRSQAKAIEHAKRRFIEERFMSNILIDDYAHHPTEVKVTIEAAKKKYPDRKLVALFRAHTKSRVAYFSKEFAEALSIADKAYVMDIGEDRIEEGYDKVSCYDILDKMSNGEHIGFEDAEKLLQYRDAVLLFMSSKDIYILMENYKELANRKTKC